MATELVDYQPSPPPQLEAGRQAYLQRELAKISRSIRAINTAIEDLRKRVP